MFKKVYLSLFVILFGVPPFVSSCATKINSPTSKKVIIFVWDGLRYDVLNDPKANIPNLRELSHAGVEFQNHHSAYPTFTMNNAQAFATGDYAGKSGFYGNTLYEPWRTIESKKYGQAFDAYGNNITQAFLQPVVTEDYKILQELDKREEHNLSLLQVTSLLNEAQKAGLSTAVIGKSGPAFFQDYKSQGIILDENHVWPLSFAKELQQKNIPLPKNSPLAYSKDQVILSKNNGDPTARNPVVFLNDGSLGSNPNAALKSPFNKLNQYMFDIFIEEILPKKSPTLSVIWLRNPDTTEHVYGPGSFAYYDALQANDTHLGQLRVKLKELGIEKDTDIIVVSDHAHSNVQATKLNDAKGRPRLMYPLHEIKDDGTLGKETLTKYRKDKNTNEIYLITEGYSVSGIVRTADLITKAQLKTHNGKVIHAYDGDDCSYNFSLSGLIGNDGKLIKNAITIPSSHKICKNKNNQNKPYVSRSYFVPETINSSKNKEDIIIASNGGTDYIYIPSHNAEVANILIHFFEQREEYSALFIDDKRYPLDAHLIQGALPLSLIKLQNNLGRNPDIIVSLTSNEKVFVNGLPGVEFISDTTDSPRGNHGSFGKIDVHNVLVAFGPDFKSNMGDKIPTGNVDLAPTVAHLFHLNLPNTDGRVLLESIKNSSITQSDYEVTPIAVSSSMACNLKIFYPTTRHINLLKENKFQDHSVDSFYTEVQMHKVNLKGSEESFTYFDFAEGKRKKGCAKN